ncbi:Phosphopantothenoylcysteine decarboxylase [Podospora fimiseda]|uniref:Phosphopantothenoylcysteine decarboxylase n=1 Tax=Podospora fimiseda TaxID=252190 RepID=A0AAN7BZE2_9PEZI|nr:Phosphopantothenoylcysteine decarboxylase [Podospora fimiseda]
MSEAYPSPQPFPLGRRLGIARASSPSINEPQRPRSLHLLIAANGARDVAYAETIAVRLSKESQIMTRAIVDDMTHRLAQEIITIQNQSFKSTVSQYVDDCQSQASELVAWADLLVLAPIDADTLAKMMCGISDTLLLQVLRGWDASKQILLVPGMTTNMWENPVSKRQMSKLHRKWNWIRVINPPILWHYKNSSTKRVVEWGGFNEVLGIIKNHAALLNMGHNVEVGMPAASSAAASKKARIRLPPEIWSIIFEFTNDWELATSLGVYTKLEMPTSEGWRKEPRDPQDPLQVFMHELEWTLLTADTEAVCKKLDEAPESFHDLSALAVHLIFKFSLTGVLAYIEAHLPHIFKCFDGRTIPTKASAYYGRTEILDWWHKSPSFLEKQYDEEALNGASMRGFVHVLEWWRASGLPLRYSETAFEMASSKGHIDVLDWWKETSSQDSSINLKPGRAILGAAQWGHVSVMRWWEESGIPVGHQDAVCKMASKSGQVEVLEFWRQCRGDDKLQFDNQILIEPTYHAYIPVLEWWRKYAHGELPGMNGRKGKRVEYKTMDVEEALEDSLGDQTKVRRWWAENGLNLGLGTSEWMKIRSL